MISSTVFAEGLVSDSIIEMNDIVDRSAINTIEKGVVGIDLANVFEDILPSVVSISTIKNTKYDNEYYEDNFEISQSIGSGFIISSDGYIITNNHVIDGAEKINVRLKGSNTDFQADIIGVDEILDIALLKLNLKTKLPFVEFNTANDQRVGDMVLVAGNPYNLGTSVSVGIISGLNRNLGLSAFDNFIQTDASINKGNSGGPMFNINGKVVGLTSAIYSPNGEKTSIGFAIPTNDLLPIVQELKKYGYVRRGWIGVLTTNTQREIFDAINTRFKSGVIITKIEKNSPADRSNLKVSDIILSYNGKKIKTPRELSLLISSTEVGSEISLNVLRNGKEFLVKVKVDEAKENYKYDVEYENILSKSIEVFDMFLTPITRESKRRFNIEENEGMYVLRVKKDGFANKKGIKAGDVIISINQDVITDKNVIFENIHKAKINKLKYVFLITSKGNLIFVPIKEGNL